MRNPIVAITLLIPFCLGIGACANVETGEYDEAIEHVGESHDALMGDADADPPGDLAAPPDLSCASYTCTTKCGDQYEEFSYGHTYHSCAPGPAAAIRDADAACEAEGEEGEWEGEPDFHSTTTSCTTDGYPCPCDGAEPELKPEPASEPAAAPGLDDDR